MKLGYYHYYFKFMENDRRLTFDINSFIQTYLDFSDQEWKDSLKKDNDSIYFIRTNHERLYMLVETRDQELIKIIKSDGECEDIRRHIQQDASIAFAAYFYVSKEFIALAATLRGPRIKALETFINMILKQLSSNNRTLKFFIQPVGTKITFEEASAMAHVSSTELVISNKNNIYQSILHTLFNNQDLDSIKSVKIIIKGKQNVGLDNLFSADSSNLVDKLDNCTLRAKRVIEENLTDFYLMREGRYSKELGVYQSEEEINQAIMTNVRQRSSEVDEFLNKMKSSAIYISVEQYTNDEVQILNDMGNKEYWSDRISFPPNEYSTN